MLKEAPVLPALMVKVLHSQSVSVDNLPSCSKGSSKMMSDIQKLEVKKKNQYTLHIHFILGGNTLRRANMYRPRANIEGRHSYYCCRKIWSH